MMLTILLAALQAAAPVGPVEPAVDRFDRCANLARTDPAAAHVDAARWIKSGGTWRAQQCDGLAFTSEGKFAAAAEAFANAARAAQLAHDPRAAEYFAQAGNAWLAAGEASKARAALDSELLLGTLGGLQLGEAQLDQARVLVAAGEMDGARNDIDRALQSAGDDPLAWLLSATLARRMGNPTRAATDIAEALKRSPDDASVQLEAGNIAAVSGNEARAKEAWGNAARIAPDTAVGRHAKAALAQFGATASPSATKPAEGR